MQARERLGSELVGFQPQDHEILAAFIVISARGIPQDETRLREGLKAASVAAPFLSRFLDDDK